MNKEKYFASSMLLLFVYTLPLVIGGTYYFDDIFRATFERSGWTADGRPLSDIIYTMLSFGGNAPDIYPFPLYASFLLFTVSSFLLCKRLELRCYISAIAIFLPIVINPIFISNLAFRFDGALMLASQSIIILIFSLNRSKFYTCLSVLLLIMSICIYQASINSFICLSAIELCIFSCIKTTSYSIKNVLSRIFQLFIAYAIYSLLILKVISIGDYFNEISQTIHLDKNIFLNISSNIYLFYSFINSIFDKPLLLLISCIFICFMYHAKNAIKDINLVKKIIAVISLLTCALSIPGVQAFSLSPTYYARTLFSFGIFISFMIYVISLNSKKTAFVASSIFLAYSFMSMSSFANSSRMIYEWNNKVSQSIIYEINEKIKNTTDKIVISGTLVRPKLSTVNSGSFLVVNSFLPDYYSNLYDGGRFMLMQNGYKDVYYTDKETAKKYIEITIGAEPIYSSNVYSLFNVDNTPVIIFK
ncbi:glucosyltransferase domain-containing protein [Citrobacter freundii]|nr:glucosyltransferase domain-containing protein [Citrobacter freundii]EKV0354845.1 glucosyltransferase domain-containing protein [Citrobacter freundii]EKV0475163.1 glucosyltransferase domain-containing protein [Citrobacter freundii]